MPSPEASVDTDRWELPLPGGATVCCTGRGDGDFADPDGAALGRRRERVVARPWSVPRQVHGATVVTVASPGEGNGVEADALVTRRSDVALAVLTADCAPVAFSSPEGVTGVAHAGWRGLVAGVIPATVRAMADLGATTVHAALGPCVHPGCYRFDASDLDAAVERGGEALRGVDRHGEPALDLPAGVRAALEACGATLVADAAVCTACSSRHWSWRARKDRSRQATVVWRG